MRLTRIIATLGPASFDENVLRKLITAGVDVFRLNFSHGTHESHKAAVETVRSISLECDRPVGILQDLCGPKIRVGEMKDGCIELAAGQETVITVDDVTGTTEKFSCSYKPLSQDAKKGDKILLNDGLLELEVRAISGHDVRCIVIHGGELKSHKGMNLPGMKLSTPSVTEKDLKDLQAGLDMGVDFVALSFVREAADLKPVRKMIKKHTKKPKVIAKIEKPEALDNINSLIKAADGVMVARGDLGVEIPAEKLPAIQQDIIYKANEADKIVITATQMLESMIHNPVPTRAEVTDVSVAISQGSDAVMLSGESAAGSYPVEAVKMMCKIAKETEKSLAKNHEHWNWRRKKPYHPLGEAISDAAYKMCDDLSSKAIIAYTASGATALYLSKSRPFAPVIAFTNNREAARQMRLYWGVEPVFDGNILSNSDLRRAACKYCLQEKITSTDDKVIVLTARPFGMIEHTNGVEILNINGKNKKKKNKDK